MMYFCSKREACILSFAIVATYLLKFAYVIGRDDQPFFTQNSLKCQVFDRSFSAFSNVYRHVATVNVNLLTCCLTRSCIRYFPDVLTRSFAEDSLVEPVPFLDNLALQRQGA